MKTKDAAGVLLIAITLLIVAAGIYASGHFKHPRGDPETLCPRQGPTAVTLILIDRTDPLSAEEHTYLRDIINRERDRLLVGEKIVISVLEQPLSSTKTALRTIVGLCNPGSEANPLFENPKRVMARYTQTFSEPIANALEKVQISGSAKYSPIIEALNSLVTEFGPAPKRKLIIFSDLMEHTSASSAYSGTFTQGTLEKSVAPDVQTWIKGANIEIYVPDRKTFRYRQIAARAAWRQFFATLFAETKFSVISGPVAEGSIPSSKIRESAAH